MRDAIDRAGAQQFGRDPAGQAARAAVAPERVFGRMTDVGGFEPSDTPIGAGRSGKRSAAISSSFAAPGEKGQCLRGRRRRRSRAAPAA